ncbi:MAG: hypothetical protein ACP5P6_06240 [Candidatus Saccharicenans sp.]
MPPTPTNATDPNATHPNAPNALDNAPDPNATSKPQCYRRRLGTI